MDSQDEKEKDESIKSKQEDDIEIMR